jgi:hypothetical protein
MGNGGAPVALPVRYFPMFEQQFQGDIFEEKILLDKARREVIMQGCWRKIAITLIDPVGAIQFSMSVNA